MLSKERRFVENTTQSYKKSSTGMTNVFEMKLESVGYQVGQCYIWLGSSENEIEGVLRTPWDLNNNERSKELCGNNLIFQQHNVAIHTLKKIKEPFKEKKVQILEWPARSTGFNSTDNLWGTLTRHVYANKSRCSNARGIKKRDKRGMEFHIARQTQNVYGHKHIFEVLSNRGGSMKYWITSEKNNCVFFLLFVKLLCISVYSRHWRRKPVIPQISVYAE